MADLNLAQRFGSNALYDEASKILAIDLNDFLDSSNGGDFTNGLGIDSLTNYTAANIDSLASSIFYALILLNAQNQSPGINDDAAEKLYLTEGGVRVNTSGTRTGQVQRLLTLNVFDTNNTIANIVDIDQI